MEPYAIPTFVTPAHGNDKINFMDDPENPYASPALEASGPAQQLGSDDLSTDERLRQRHINVETSLRAVGGLIFIIGSVAFFLTLVAVWQSDISADAVFLVLWGLGSAVLVVLGFGMRRFLPWARALCAIVVGIFLASALLLPWEAWLLACAQFGVGAYVLYLAFGTKGRFVFTAEYAAIRRRTPHIKYRAGSFAQILILLVIIVIVLGLLLPAIH